MKKYLLNQQESKTLNLLFILFLVVALLSGCATTEVADDSEIGHQPQDQPLATGEAGLTEEAQAPEEQQVDAEEHNNDPIEGFNRAIYGFNETVDDYVFEPVASGYQWLFPQFIQTGVSNFYNNFKNISVVLNDLLQGKFKQGGEDTGRVVHNYTRGNLGFLDV